MGAMLDAPIVAEDGAVEELIPRGCSPAPPGVDFFPEVADEGDIFVLEDGSDDAAESSSTGKCIPPGFESAPAAGAARGNSIASTTRCRTDSENEPPSPGEALLREFTPLYHKYGRRVYRQCYRMLGNHEDAEDLTQEVFLQLYRKAHTFRGEANFSTWLYRLTVNTVLMQLRRRRRWRDTVTSLDVPPGSDDAVSDVLTMASTPTTPATGMVDKIGLDCAIAQLSSGYKEIFLLHDLEGYRHDEIATRLGISEGTSKSQLHKARNRLRTLIG